MKTYKTTLEQVETLSGLKKNFNNLNPQLISRIVEEIKNNMLNNEVVIEGLLQLEAPGNLIEIRDNLLIDIDLMLIECKNKPFEKRTKEPDSFTFEDLFETKYRLKINDLIITLKRCEYINENEVVIPKPINFARLYYYLIEKKVIRKRFERGSKGVALFFNRFGCMVVEKLNDDELCVTRGNITNEQARNTDLLDNSIKNELEKHFI